jgi:hypothetical protein
MIGGSYAPEACRAFEIERLEPVSQADGQAAKPGRVSDYENSPTSVLAGREELCFHQG